MLGHLFPMALDILEIALSLTLTLGPDACWKHGYPLPFTYNAIPRGITIRPFQFLSKSQ